MMVSDGKEGGCMAGSREVHKVMVEKAREESMKRPLGPSCSCCPSCCYSTHIITRLIISGIVCAALGLFFIGLSVPQIVQQQDSLSFVSTDCTTVSSNVSSPDQLKCNSCSDKEKKESNCYKTYPCLTIQVSYQAAKVKVNHTYLIQNYATLSQNQKCMFYNTECQGYDPNETVAKLDREYGTIGASYDCLYDANNIRRVVLERPPHKTSPLIFIVVGIILTIAGPAMALATYFACGCKYFCVCKPPPDVVEEVERRQNTHTQPTLGAGFDTVYQGRISENSFSSQSNYPRAK